MLIVYFCGLLMRIVLAVAAELRNIISSTISGPQNLQLSFWVGATAETGSASEGIVREFSDALARDQDVAVAVAVIKVQ